MYVESNAHTRCTPFTLSWLSCCDVSLTVHRISGFRTQTLLLLDFVQRMQSVRLSAAPLRIQIQLFEAVVHVAYGLRPSSQTTDIILLARDVSSL